MENFLQQLINGLTLGSIYGLIAIGYTMVFGIIGMVNFAHGDVFMLSAFIALLVFLILTQLVGLAYMPLAFLIVLVWHMAGAHLSPEAFPIDTSIFTGKIRKVEMREVSVELLGLQDVAAARHAWHPSGMSTRAGFSIAPLTTSAIRLILRTYAGPATVSD